LGFKELVAEVGLGRVGLVLALEVSRLARSSGELLARAARTGVDCAPAVPDELLGQRAEALETAAHAEREVRELLREHQRAGHARD
jgi:hypothetical protein